MNYNRRNFLKNATLISGAVAMMPTLSCGQEKNKKDGQETGSYVPAKTQDFNMCGYAAPKIDKVRIGFIGLGSRGPGAVKRISRIEGVEIVALCDKDPARATKAQGTLDQAGLPKAKEYSGEEGWKEMVTNEELDLVYICTPWDLHAPMALFAMQHGKHVACEVPLAVTIDECWE